MGIDMLLFALRALPILVVAVVAFLVWLGSDPVPRKPWLRQWWIE